MMDWWAEFWTGDTSVRGEFGHKGSIHKYYQRADGSWHRDERRDEDPRHQISIRLVCDRCSRPMSDLLAEHADSCPFSHSGEAGVPCALQLLCEGERRRSA